ncbi:hypothetical protein DIC82_16470 [Clostridium beijerinckii]|nr:hypothetical protein DIC82_16470 [Clostridium beijerinckii]
MIKNNRNNLLIISFVIILVVTIVTFLCARPILNLYGLTTDNVDGSIGDYVSSLLGAIIGVVLTMLATILLELFQKRMEKEEIEKENAILLYYDLQVLLRKTICEYWIKKSTQDNDDKDFLYKDLDDIFKDLKRDSFQELLTNTERVKIITSLNIKNKQNKLVFINFLSSDKMKFLKELDIRISKKYEQCKESYKEAYVYIDKINKYLNKYKYDSKFLEFENPLLEQIDKYLDICLKDFFMEEAEKQKTRVGKAVPMVDDQGEFSGIFYDEELFNFDSLKRAISYYDNNYDNNDDGENNFKQRYNEFYNKCSKEIEEKVNEYRLELFNNIELDDTFNDVIRMIKTDNPKFWKILHNEENYLEDKILSLDNKEFKLKKIKNIYNYIEESFLYSKEKSISKVIVSVKNGIAEYKEVELCEKPIKYRKKEYFEKCSQWDTICELFDFYLAQRIFRPSDYVSYISRLEDIELSLFPRFRESVLPEHIENICDDSYTEKIISTFEILKDIKEIAEIDD